jgi:hypothetical protein
MELWAKTELDELRWHWDEVYRIDYAEPGRWMAQRRDTPDHQGILKAGSPGELRDLIIADYASRPVSRHAAPVPREQRPRPPLRHLGPLGPLDPY